MDANGRELILKDEVYAIISCAFEVINGLGHGLHEKPYGNALVGEFIPDLIVHEQIIVDTKTIERITQIERGQMLNYLRITRLPVGLIINFKKSKLEWERIILSH